MTNFMIFDNGAVNLALVTRMTQEASGVALTLVNGGLMIAKGVTIDDILTAQAAGQSRIAKISSETLEGCRVILDKTEKIVRRSSRFREPQHNDPQALRSIGRR